MLGVALLAVGALQILDPEPRHQSLTPQAADSTMMDWRTTTPAMASCLRRTELSNISHRLRRKTWKLSPLELEAPHALLPSPEHPVLQFKLHLELLGVWFRPRSQAPRQENVPAR